MTYLDNILYNTLDENYFHFKVDKFEGRCILERQTSLPKTRYDLDK